MRTMQPPWRAARTCAALLAALGLPAGSAAADPRAERVTADALPGEGFSHLAEVALAGEYAHVDDSGGAGIADLGALGLRSRLLVGRRLAWCLGLDGEIGGSDAGLVYGATGYLVGGAARFGDSGLVALCGGAGVDGIRGALPAALRLPAELSLGVDLGAVRVGAWASAVWLRGADARADGVSWASAVDEADAGLLVRFARQHRYWGTMNAGGGVAIGLLYRALADTSYVGVTLGIDLVGAR
jgi:hypothetical protein